MDEQVCLATWFDAKPFLNERFHEECVCCPGDIAGGKYPLFIASGKQHSRVVVITFTKIPLYCNIKT